MFILGLLVGGFLGFFLAIVAVTGILNKKGYSNFDDIPLKWGDINGK